VGLATADTLRVDHADERTDPRRGLSSAGACLRGDRLCGRTTGRHRDGKQRDGCQGQGRDQTSPEVPSLHESPSSSEVT
jgi:hypothetical protein